MLENSKLHSNINSELAWVQNINVDHIGSISEIVPRDIVSLNSLKAPCGFFLQRREQSYSINVIENQLSRVNDNAKINDKF